MKIDELIYYRDVVEHPVVFGGADQEYRYFLKREWDADLPAIQFVGLNPSTADATQDDPTIRRCVGFATRWGYGRLFMTNLFAIRATDPRDMKAHPEPIGEHNDSVLRAVSHLANATLLCWGNHGTYQNRGETVADLIRLSETPVLMIRKSKTNQPVHPLMEKYIDAPEEWTA